VSTVRVAGVGMIPFTKPGQSEDWDVMAEKAIRIALEDAGVSSSAAAPTSIQLRWKRCWTSIRWYRRRR
jgi:hypothetical protein